MQYGVGRLGLRGGPVEYVGAGGFGLRRVRGFARIGGRGLADDAGESRRALAEVAANAEELRAARVFFVGAVVGGLDRGVGERTEQPLQFVDGLFESRDDALRLAEHGQRSLELLGQEAAERGGAAVLVLQVRDLLRGVVVETANGGDELARARSARDEAFAEAAFGGAVERGPVGWGEDLGDVGRELEIDFVQHGGELLKLGDARGEIVEHGARLLNRLLRLLDGVFKSEGDLLGVEAIDANALGEFSNADLHSAGLGELVVEAALGVEIDLVGAIEGATELVERGAGLLLEVDGLAFVLGKLVALAGESGGGALGGGGELGEAVGNRLEEGFAAGDGGGELLLTGNDGGLHLGGEFGEFLAGAAGVPFGEANAAAGILGVEGDAFGVGDARGDGFVEFAGSGDAVGEVLDETGALGTGLLHGAERVFRPVEAVGHVGE